jgi:membrane associated rhomboid family serine protease
MILPIGDDPKTRIRPVMTYLLIFINVMVFIALLPLQEKAPDPNDPELLEYLLVLSAEYPGSLSAIASNLSEYDLVLFRHGYRPAVPSATGLVSSMFLHDGLLHLGGNMLFLGIFGDNVEERLGRPAFVLVYLVTGMAATLFFGLFAPDMHLPLVGASGAISGVLGCYFVWFPNNRVRLLVWLLIFITVVRIPARWVLGVYLVIDNIVPFALRAADSGVAYGAHIGGFLAGALVAVVLLSWAKPRKRP